MTPTRTAMARRLRPRSSAPATARGLADRRALLAEARRHLLTHGWPRLQTSLIVTGAGGCAVLVSVLLLWSGVDRMGWRYALAATAGYAAFLGLVGVWVRWHRHPGPGVDGGLDLGVDALLEAPLPRGRTNAVRALFEGGASGGGGGGATFDGGGALFAASPGPGSAATSGVADVGGGAGSWLAGLFDEDGAFLVLAAACAAAALVAVGYVVYAAPVLLAEVALDAALLGALYRRLRREDARHWTRGLVRGTWVAALVIVLSAAAVGYLLQRAVPEARSIGGVVRGLAAGADDAP